MNDSNEEHKKQCDLDIVEEIKVEAGLIHNDQQQSSNSFPSFRSTNWRWLVLAIAAAISFCSYHCYDYPNALNNQIKDKITHEKGSDKEVKYIELYSAYSFPNIVLPLLGGIFIDCIGVYSGLILFSFLCVVGQGVFVYAGTLGNNHKSDDWPFIWAMIGRFIYGMGEESLGIAENTLISKWFEGKELSLALGVTLSISWFSNTVVNYTIPFIVSQTSLVFTLTIGLIICVCAFILCFAFIYMDKYAKNVDKSNGIDVGRDAVEKFQFKDLKKLKFSFWFIVVLAVFTYEGTIFNNISNDYFQNRYGFTQVEAGRIGSNVFLLCVVLTPILGIISDRFGYRVTFSIVGSCLLCLSHILFMTIPSSKASNKSYLGIIPVALMGISLAIYSSVIYTMIPIIVKPSLHGTAFGICMNLLNTGVLCFGILTSLINGSSVLCQLFIGMLTFEHLHENAYIYANIFLLAITTIGVFMGVGLSVNLKNIKYLFKIFKNENEYSFSH